jgi:hypothetical protein
MVGNPVPPPSSGQTPDFERVQADEREPAGERIGPVTIERLRKDDGRALILYSATRERAGGSST